MVGDVGSGAIGGDTDGSLKIGSPQSGSLFTVTLHNTGMRVMEYIEASTGDDDVLGSDRTDEIRMTRRATAVVRGFQDFRL